MYESDIESIRFSWKFILFEAICFIVIIVILVITNI